MDRLETVIAKYKGKVEELEAQLSDTKKMLNALIEESKLLNDQRNLADQSSLFNKTVIVLSNKYEKMTMPQAILNVLENKIDWIVAQTIYDEMLQNGFKSESKTLLGDIYGRLNSLEKEGKVISKKEGKGLKQYKYSEGGKEKI
jgi:hypothetical protein